MQINSKYQSIILAAGKGTRMNANSPSPIPKVLFKVGGRYIIDYVLDKQKQVGIDKPILVVGYQHEKVEQELQGKALFVFQENQLGTGDAVKTAIRQLPDEIGEYVFIVMGDMPLWRVETFNNFKRAVDQDNSVIAISQVKFDDPMLHVFGRIIKDDNGNIMKVIEQKMASPEQQQIKECNGGLYLCQSQWLKDNIGKITKSYGDEYPLTDLVELAYKQGRVVSAVETDEVESIGINTLEHLEMVEKIIKEN